MEGADGGAEISGAGARCGAAEIMMAERGAGAAGAGGADAYDADEEEDDEEDALLSASSDKSTPSSAWNSARAASRSPSADIFNGFWRE